MTKYLSDHEISCIRDLWGKQFFDNALAKTCEWVGAPSGEISLPQLTVVAIGILAEEQKNAKKE